MILFWQKGRYTGSRAIAFDPGTFHAESRRAAMRRQFTAAVPPFFLAAIVAAIAVAAEPVEIVVKYPVGQVYKEESSGVGKTVYTVVASGESRTYTQKISKESVV